MGLFHLNFAAIVRLSDFEVFLTISVYSDHTSLNLPFLKD
jgi:hypothetical protein